MQIPTGYPIPLQNFTQYFVEPKIKLSHQICPCKTVKGSRGFWHAVLTTEVDADHIYAIHSIDKPKL